MYNNGGRGSIDERKAIFSVPVAEGEGFDARDLNKDGVVDEEELRETEDAFEDALGRDETSLKKEKVRERPVHVEREGARYE